MLKKAFDEGFQAGLAKFALAVRVPGGAGKALQGLAGWGMRNPNLALAGVGAGLGALQAPEGEGLQGAMIGGGLGYGAGRLGAGKAIQRGVVSPKKQWLGEGARNYAYDAMMANKNRAVG